MMLLTSRFLVSHRATICKIGTTGINVLARNKSSSFWNKFKLKPRDSPKVNNTPELYVPPLSTLPLVKPEPSITVTFEQSETGECHTVLGRKGDSLFDVVREHNLDFTGFGVCDGTMACSTCHLILEPADYETLEAEITEEETDILELANGVTDTSRLGCQIVLNQELNGLKVKVPMRTGDVRNKIN